MSELTAKSRKAIPKGKFALPSERKYPIEDKAHAANAKARASEMEHKGKISSSTKTRIDSAADRVLHRRPQSKKPRDT
jgi:hypothetical protein